MDLICIKTSRRMSYNLYESFTVYDFYQNLREAVYIYT